jgi:hypothetical protein
MTTLTYTRLAASIFLIIAYSWCGVRETGYDVGATLFRSPSPENSLHPFDAATLSVPNGEVRRWGACGLSIPEIAARAGVGQTKARIAIREADRMNIAKPWNASWMLAFVSIRDAVTTGDRSL